MRMQHIDCNKYIEIWCDAISEFLNFKEDGIAVFRPAVIDRDNYVIEQIKARFADTGRLFIDEEDDNKFWLARADYFVTDYSEAFVNFSMASKKPSIRMIYSSDEKMPEADAWGWSISRPNQITPLLEKMDKDEKKWYNSLLNKQKCEFPNIGKNFNRLSSMVMRILNNDDCPEWFKIEKGHTSCKTHRDMLILIAKITKKSNYSIFHLRIWFEMIQLTLRKNIQQGWLLLLRRALLHNLESDYPEEIAKNVDIWLSNALDNLPFIQTVGLVRHCMLKNSKLAATALLLNITSNSSLGYHKKRGLFFLLMEWDQCDREVLTHVDELAERMPQHFARPTMKRLYRFLTLVMKFPLPLRRFAARILGLKKPLAKDYWWAHRVLCLKRH